MNSKAIRKQLLAAVAMVLVAAVALGSSTYAWFVSNNTVTATMSKVSAASTTTNLLIKECSAAGVKVTSGGSTAATVSLGSTVALYPSSLALSTGLTGNNGKVGESEHNEWFVVNKWTNDNNKVAKANGYTTPVITKPSNGNGAGQYTTDGGSTTLNAYALASYTVYTTSGTADLYLGNTDAPAIAITKTNSSDDNDSKEMLTALRIGLVVDGNLKLVYAPYAESAAGGNDLAYEEDGTSYYKQVHSSTTAGDPNYVILAGTNGALTAGEVLTGSDNSVYSAVKEGDGSYTAPTSSAAALKTGVDSTGALIEIYVWIEGTDTNCLTEEIAGDLAQYSITVTFAGVKST